MRSGIEIGFALDRQWHRLRGDMERIKEPALLLVGRILGAAGVPYAIIGGVAMQVHHPDPRTTLDIDVAVTSRDRIPCGDLEAARFTLTGRFAHSENWSGPGDTPVRFRDDPALAGAVTRAVEVPVAGQRLRVIGRADLLHEKLRAGSDPARRRSKRLQDLADAQALLEADAELVATLAPEERALLDRLPE
jgi:hypothetical protein